MPKNLLLAVFRALIVAALVITGFFTLIKTTEIDRTRLTPLSVTATGITGFPAKAATKGSESPATSPLAAIKASYKKNPELTGTYSSIWDGPKAKEQSVVLNIDLLSTPAEAAETISETNTSFFSGSNLKADSKVVHFTVPTLPKGGIYSDVYANATSDSPNTVSTVIAFHTGRIAVLVVGGGAATIPRSQVIALAERQYQLVRSVPADFTLNVTVHPVGYAFLYFLIGAALIAFAFDGVHWIRAAKEQRVTRQEALVRYHYQSRGAKVLRSRSRPPRRR